MQILNSVFARSLFETAFFFFLIT